MAVVAWTVGLAISGMCLPAMAQDAAPDPTEIAQVERGFNSTCATCHGENAGGGDRAPALVNNPRLRALDVDGIASIIRNGQRSMPAFSSLPQSEVARLAQWLHSMNVSALGKAPLEQVAAGESLFFGVGGCSGCHMVRGRGTANGPDLSGVAARSTRAELEKWLGNPTSMMGTKTLASCHSHSYCADFQWALQDVTLKDGAKLRGFARNRSEHVVALQTLDGKLHMIDDVAVANIAQEKQSYMPALHASANQRRDVLAYLSSLGGIEEGPITGNIPPVSQAEIAAVMNAKPGEWPTYYGSFDGNRYSPLLQINTKNAAKLQPQWIFAPSGTSLEGTPVVLDGIMYVTGGPQTCALDAKSGLPIWCTPRTNGLGVAKSGAPVGFPGMAKPGPIGPNRGVAILGDRLYYTSDDAFIVCLNRLTGAVMWSERLYAPGAVGQFYSSSAPLVVGDLVITGIAGGDAAMRGFIVAYHADSGKEAWRFYTVPKPGEPASETWIGRGALPNGGGATWVTGSYDSETQTLYWAVGNPYPDTDASERAGTNLYTNSVVALDAKTGKLKWHFQFTPYDTHDWDATQPMVLVDTIWKGKPRKLLLSAQRSGIFYVLDRTNGQFLLAKPFVKKMTWASGFNRDGSPILASGNTPTLAGTKTCPGARGATNWYSTAYNPATRLFYVMAAEDCGIYRTKGDIFGNNPDPSDPGMRFVRALDIETGDTVWEKPLVGPQDNNYTGVLSTAGGLIFHGETGGDFAAVDAKTGETLYTFHSNDSWRATPMTYSVDGRQYVAGMDGSVLLSFALGNN